MRVLGRHGISSLLRGITLVVVTAFFTTAVHAAAYQTEAGLIYETTDADSNVDITTIGAAGTYYFAPVNVKGPLAEAEFLAKASGVGAGLLSVDADIGSTSVDGNGYFVGMRYVVPGPDVVLGLIVDSLDASGGGVKLESSSTTFQIGKYVSDTALLQFSYLTGNQKISGLPKNDIRSIVFSGDWLTETNGKDLKLRLSFGQDSYDYNPGSDGTNTILGLDAVYYIDDTLGIGAGFATNSGDDSSTEGSTITFSVNKFLSNTMSVSFGYETFAADSGDDSTTLSLGISGRF